MFKRSMILKWNDESSFHGGKVDNRFFEKGDVFPASLISKEIMKQWIESGRLIQEQTPLINPIKLSISVMAHPSREHFFKGLQDKLKIPMTLFSIDNKNNLLENCKAAWRLYDKNADFHVVIQDDAIVCNNFKERAIKFITEMESERIGNKQPVYGYNFFIKPEYTAAQMTAFANQGYILEPRNRGGVAICLPVNQIESMLQYFDTLKSRHDDERINEWIVFNKFKMVFSIPSLVDHDDHNPSLAGNITKEKRQAYQFIDNIKQPIPKIIHQLWIGDKPAPIKWMNTWKQKNPGWLYRLWTEKDIRSEKWINQKHIDYYWNKKIWHGLKDVCQYEILYNNGGCFFDADTECLLPIGDLFKGEFDAYSYYESEEARPGLIQPLIASIKGSEFALELIEGLKKLDTVEEPWKTTGNQYVGEMYKKTLQTVKIFPSHYFNPEHFTGINYKGTDKIYARHHYGSTIDGTYEKGI